MNNVLIIQGNAQICLRDMIDDRSVENIFIFHPDPWLKKKQHKRRIINPAFLELAAQKLSPKGKIYITTDVSVLWDDIMDKFSQNSAFKQIEASSFWKNAYTTHWGKFSINDNRSSHQAVFQIE
ncbi:hypothetical protein ACFLZV_07340 [Candidatus Margulisiibacteriota bacterium]